MTVSVRLCVFYILIPTAWIPHVYGKEYVMYMGCYKDLYVTARLLREYTENTGKLATIKTCLDTCRRKYFRYAGVEWGVECFCSNERPPYYHLADEEDCNYKCGGDETQTCGGDKRINVYDLQEIVNAVESQYVGCFTDSAERMLNMIRYDSDLLTPELCVGYCHRRGYRFAGMEARTECYCGDTLRMSAKVDNAKCSAKCEGEKSFKCGGDWLLSVYHTGISDLSENENLIGCYKDDFKKVRLLTGTKLELLESNTPRRCMNICLSLGYKYAGTEFRFECFCGNRRPPVESEADEKDCHLICPGNPKEFCGGSWRILVYSTGLSEYENLIGCYKDDFTKVRLLTATKIELRQTNTPSICMEKCLKLGYKYAGTEYRFECFCGNKKPPVESEAEENECQQSCPGNPKEFCGGNYRIQVYSTGFGIVDATIPELTMKDPVIPPSQLKCEPSVTTVNRKNVCKGELIFTEDFNNNQLDLQNWGQEIYMPWLPDYSFVTFTESPENTYVKNGKLFIKPTVKEDDFVKTGKVELQHCTGQPYSEECKRQAATYNILPPISSGKICTKDFFSFQYGIVQITVKLPIGDWIVPEILLEPRKNSYGSGYSSGRVRIVMARGNRHLTVGTSDIGNKRVKSGILMAHLDNAKELSVIRDKTKEWHDRFHNFTLVWSPENFAFLVDGSNEEKFIPSDDKKLCRIVGFNDQECEIWEDGAPLAPFDKEFYLSIGLSVGGMRDFPDGSVSGNDEKPWKDFQVKAMANFWRAKESWLPTWNDEESALQVDSIRIYAL